MTVQPPSLLVVDDEQGILDVVGRFARRAGFEVVACPGGHEAIAQLRTRHADVAMRGRQSATVGRRCDSDRLPSRQTRLERRVSVAAGATRPSRQLKPAVELHVAGGFGR